MQPQGQQMQGMGMQMGQPMQQPTPPETQSNMQPIQNENQMNQPITQQPDALQAPGMIQNGNMNMAQSQIYENPVEPKQETAAAAPPPPPNDPPFNNLSNENPSPITTENLNDVERKAEDYRKEVRNYLDDLTDAELDIFKQELNNKQPNPSPMDMQGTVK